MGEVAFFLILGMLRTALVRIYHTPLRLSYIVDTILFSLVTLYLGLVYMLPALLPYAAGRIIEQYIPLVQIAIQKKPTK